MKYIFYILFLFSSLQFSEAQIKPAFTGVAPALTCVRNEASNQISIQWNGSTQPGACFSQYGVYIALNDKNGPYQKIDSIKSSNAGILTFDPKSNGIVYVMLINEQNCPTGSTKIQTSDTLDNIVPQAAPTIVKISVQNDIPTLYWEASKNPEVTGYAIYSISNNYNEPIDTVLGRNSTSYTNINHHATDSVAVYKIRSIEYCEDPKGLFSNITPPYNTIKISRTDEDVCKRSVVLDWNGYNNQKQPILGYKVEYSEDAGNTYIEKEIIADTTRKYEFVGLKPQATTCIRIQAILPNQDSSLSNVLCIFSQGLIPVENHYIQNITVNSDNVSLEYIPDPKVNIGEIVLERSSSGDQFTVLSTGVSIQKDDILNVYSIKDFSALSDRSALYYRVSVKDDCSNKYSTLPAKTVLLEGKNLGLNNEIIWDTSAVDNDQILGYDVYRVVEGDTTKIFSSNNGDTYTDANIYSQNYYVEACYFVVAQHQTTNIDRPQEVLLSNSNTVCLEPTPQAFVPNAFAPLGFNKIFKPILVFGSDVDYTLEIFNRLGTKVFETSDPNIGWDGKYKGKVNPLDSYVYHLQFTGLNGQIYKKTGFVVIVQ
jgi:gliding motility-associated-like protein